MLNSMNNNPFGSKLASKMKIGALVSWCEWMIADNNLIEAVFYGVIVGKTTKIEGNRAVCIIKVACSKTGEVLLLNPFQLRIEEPI